MIALPGSDPGNAGSSGNNYHQGGNFWGHHHNTYNPDAFGDGSPNAVAYAHHHHQNLYDVNMYPLSMTPPPSNFIINMAPPPITQPLPIRSLSITKYFYSQPPRLNYNYGYFGGYGSTYGGYGYLPTRAIASLLFRLLSLIGFGGSNQYNTALNPNNFLGTWGPQSSLMTGAFDNTNATNFVDNYSNFNYTGGNVQPFANLLPDGTPYGDNDPQNLSLQQSSQTPGDQQNLASQNQNQPNFSQQSGNSQDSTEQNPDRINRNLLSMVPQGQYLPPGLAGQVTDNVAADSEQQVELKATALPLLPVPLFQQPIFDYHHIGVLGSAFTHNIKLPAGTYRAPEILGLIFTHQFWDAPEQQQTIDEEQQPPILTQQN